MKVDWQLRPLSEVCQFQRGLTYSKEDEVAFSGNAVLRATNINLASHLLDFEELKYISDRFDVPVDKKVKKGSLVICTSSGSKSHLGKVAFIDDDYGYAFGGFIGMLTPTADLEPRYLFHLMTSPAYEDFIGMLAGGMNINNLKFDDLKQFQVPLPPLAEQARIVATLDKAFAAIATARANTEQARHNAESVFVSYLNAIFTRQDDGWAEGSLGEFVDGISTGPFGSLLHKSDYRRGGIPLVNPINIEGAKIVPDDHKAVSPGVGQRLSSYALREGDVVVARRGEIGRCAVIDSDQAGWLCGTGCFFIRPSARTDPQFLAHLLRSRPYRSRLEGLSARATMPSISNVDLANLPVRLPSVAEQERVSGRLRDLGAETSRLAALYEQRLAALDALKRSLLHAAFTGVL